MIVIALPMMVGSSLLPDLGQQFWLATALVLNFLVFAGLAYPAYCLAVKRRHDRGNRGIDVLGYIALGLVLLMAVTIVASGAPFTDAPFPLAAVAAVISLFVGLQAYSIYMLVVLGLLRGTDGPNEYGPAPLTSAKAARA